MHWLLVFFSFLFSKSKMRQLIAVLSLIGFSNAGFATAISEVEPNDDLASAQNVDASFDRSASPDIKHATFLPHVTIDGSGNNTFDYYEFTVSQAGSRGIFDLDYGYVSGNYLNAQIYIFDESGEIVRANGYSNASNGAKGSTSNNDPYISHDFESAGTYYVQVGRYSDAPVTDGTTYQLHISLSSSNLTADTDGDGMPDAYESFFSFNPLMNDAELDGDGDLLTNLEEYEYGSDPSVADTDLDGLPNESDDDDDGDGLTDAEEVALGTNPLLVDTDGDGSPDNQDAFPTLIEASVDSDSDGYPDGWTSVCDTTCQQSSSLLLDLFPYSAAAFLDNDRDGLPDEWAADCDSQCQINSGLTLDPDDQFADSDGDGLSNSEDDDDNGDGITDIDADSDGLIDVHTLAQLNAIRYNLNGAGYKESSGAVPNTSGCPIILFGGRYQQSCNGYELMNDLDFDTNADGVLDINDTYWNDGLGWLPIGSSFYANFDGNNHEIRNLYINRDSTYNIGLFAQASNADIRNLKILGEHSFVSGYYYTGLLLGHASSTSLINIEVEGRVVGAQRYAGLLSGNLNESVINNVRANGQVRAVDDYAGVLAGQISNSTATQLIAQGRVEADRYVGGIAGYLTGELNAAQANVVVRGSSNIGGLLGYAAANSQIANSVATGYVHALSGNAGGLIGEVHSGSAITNSFAATLVEGSAPTQGGLIGYIYRYSDPVVVSNSYWANDLVETSHLSDEATGYVGVSLATLQCAIQADTNSENSDCVSEDGSGEGLSAPLTLFNGWGSAGFTDDQGVFQAYWDFGSELQLPGLSFNGAAHRDSDGDGIDDENDAWDNDRAVSIDTDGDGYPDSWNTVCDAQCIANSGFILDQFPNSAAGYADADLDGLLDSWADTCNEQCQIDSGLTLDSFPNDADNDGLLDDVDTDDNNDGITDIDADSDGLIDITNLAQLNAMRYALDGFGYRVDADSETDTSGCPAQIINGVYQRSCVGYELLNDLDFDSNADGVVDASDEYWNEGAGWEPVGHSSTQSFRANLEGNNFEIRNLTINRPHSDYIGLLGYVRDSNIRNVNLSQGSNTIYCEDYCGFFAGLVAQSQVANVQVSGRILEMDGNGGLVIGRATSSELIHLSAKGSINGEYQIGGIAGYLSGEIIGSQANVELTGHSNVGGLVGFADDDSRISNTYATGYISALYDNIGGLIGRLENGSEINNSFATASVSGRNYVGGLAGYVYSYSSSPTVINNSYWANDLVESSHLSSEQTGYVGLPLATLQCAIQADTTFENSDCVSQDGSGEGLSGPLTLFKEWGLAGYVDELENFHAYWSFGDSQQLPGLNILGALYQDSDGDGYADVDDHWIKDRAAALDDDSDGYPDRWNQGCDEQCVAESGLILDQFPSSSAAYADSDLDGLPDSWAETCDEQCRMDSGLTLDSYPNDADNDGLPDAVDTDDNNDGIADIDADSDGLIDISTLEQLDAMRYALDGAGYKMDAESELDQSGCPTVIVNGTYQRRCRGYELLNDLDFDTNGDGVISESDDYWNNGYGWIPVGGSSDAPFIAALDGNGFSIRNLFIERSSSYVGLIGYARDAQIKNLSLLGELTSVQGRRYTGIVAGLLSGESTIQRVAVSGSVEMKNTYSTPVGGITGYLDGASSIEASMASVVVVGMGSVGGLVGHMEDGARISNTFATGAVVATASYAGGLVGRMDSYGSITNSYATVDVAGLADTGGLVGSASSYATVTNSYWSSDRELESSLANGSPNYAGLPDTTLKCAVQADTTFENSDCVSEDGSAEGLSGPLTLFNQWGEAGYLDEDDVFHSYWTFGSEQQLPALTLNGVDYRDSDGDGVLDQFDQWQLNYAAAVDGDGDGYPDRWTLGCDSECIANSGLTLDQFPQSDAGYLDADLDGLLDGWADTCDAQCQIDSGLTLDAHPDDVDNDGLSDLLDNDDNNDGLIDIDSDSDGLVDIQTLAQLNAMRFSLNGLGYRSASNDVLDQAGCPTQVLNGVYQRSCVGYELMNDLDMDSNSDGQMTEADTFWNDGAGWSPIGSSSNGFEAIFDGNGYKINNLYIHSTNSYLALFAKVEGAEIRNLTFDGALSQIQCNQNCGFVAGLATQSVFSNINVNGSVHALYSSAGLLVGTVAYDSLIESIQLQGAVTTDNDQIGLLAGFARQSSVKNVEASGSVIGVDDVIGGMIGSTNDTTLMNVVADVTVQGDSSVGGIVGSLYRGELSHAVALGDASGNNYVGGIAGYASDISITNTLSSVNIDGDSTLGGIVGRLYQGTVSAAFSSGLISGNSSVGGLIGYSQYGNIVNTSLSSTRFSSVGAGLIGSGGGTFSNSYWANDVAGTNATSGYSESNSFVGLTLRTLQCGLQANTSFENSDCVSEDGSSENLNGPVTLFKDWQLVGESNEAEEFTAYWSYADANQLPFLTINGVEYKDSDGDGTVDTSDAHPFDHDNDGVDDSIDGFVLIPITGHTDTDSDGIPDDCESECQATGMFADVDDDGDGVLDVDDAFPLISLDGRTDTDGDGAPDTCDADCILLGMTEDLDDDNDGYLDDVDAFRTDPTEWADFDGDGEGDNADLDDDNDGVLDEDDENLGQDDGAPYFVATELEERNQSVTTDNGHFGDVTFDSDYFITLGADDLFDSELTIEGTFNGDVISLDDDVVRLPAGRQIIEWVAIDTAGNRSDPLEQVVNIYPQVRFDLDASVVGEGTDAQVVVRLTGDSPEYPVVVNLQMNVASDVDQDDLDAEVFDTALVHQVTITQGEEETLNREGILRIPVLQDDVSENDELMLIDLLGVPVEEGEDNFFAVDEAHNQHGLTVTYENQQPTVQIQFEQSGSVVSNITLDAGLVTVSALVVDENQEGLIYQWTIDDRLELVEPTAASFNFDPSSLVTGSFEFTVQVTDNGLGSLQGTASETIEIVLFNGFVDTDGDGIPNNCPQVCIDLGMEADTDDDNDGILDDDDFYQLISLGGRIDTNGNGIPDNCDTACEALGMTADTDDDGDGVLDEDDFYPLIPLDGRLDSDGDGIPNDCTPACTLPMLADTDDDNDGVPDEFDVFDLDPSEWADFDGDLIGDNADTDDDNDGVEDALDPSLGDDNGAPVFDANLVEQHVGVTSEHGSAGFITIDESFYDALNATDAVDTELVYQGTWNNNPLVINDENQVWLSAGRQVIEWVAIDDAGNQSDSIEQIINVYPRVRFDLDGSVSGEGSDASVVVRLTGDSPVYPVVVNLEVNGLSEVDQLDVASEFDLALPHQVTITQGDGEMSLNREAVLTIPVLQDNQVENDEQLLVDLTGVAVAEGEENYFVVDETYQQFSLIITEQNLAPTVELLLKQNDQEVANIATDGGLVTVSAVVTDPNGDDTHTYTWDVGELPLNPVTSSNLVFDPANLEAGAYSVSVSVGDSGIDSLTVEANLSFMVTEPLPPVVNEPEVAPTLQLILMQDGQQVANIQQEGGLVTVRAVVNDPNTGESHTLNWELSALGLSAPDGSELTFDPVNIPSAVYTIEVTVTDSENLTSTQSMTIAIVSESDGRTTGSGDSGSSGGGPILWLLMLLMSAGMVRVRSR